MSGIKNFSIKQKNKGLLKLLAGAVVLAFLIFVINFFAVPIKNFVYALSSPVQKTLWTAGESSAMFFSSFAKAGFLTKENNNLKIQNQKLLAEVASLQSIAEANNAQAEVSLSCQNSGFNLVMAGVIGLDDKDILSINKGSADGIAEGMPVINQQKVLFGKIYKVYNNFSQIMLVSNKDSIINVKVQQEVDYQAASAEAFGEPREVDGVVMGSGNLAARLDLVPINSDIAPQENLVTSAIEKSFPKDLLVGKINRVEKNDQEPFQQAQISLFLDISSSDNLFVITNYKRAE